MALWTLELLPHFVNAGADSGFIALDETDDIAVPTLPDGATAGSEPMTAVVGSLVVGDSVTVAGFVHEIGSIEIEE